MPSESSVKKYRSLSLSIEEKDKFAAKFNRKEYKKKKEKTSFSSPPILGLFHPLTIEQIPFEVERQVRRAQAELEAELEEERRVHMDQLIEKLKFGVELCIQQDREEIIRSSSILATNTKIYNRISHDILKIARAYFKVESESDSNIEMFEDFDAVDESLPPEKTRQIHELIEAFISNYKKKIDKSVDKDIEEETIACLEKASVDGSKIIKSWEVCTHEDAHEINNTLWREAELAYGASSMCMDNEVGYLPSGSIFAPQLLSSASFMKSNFVASSKAGFNKSLFHPDMFATKANRFFHY